MNLGMKFLEGVCFGSGFICAAAFFKAVLHIGVMG
jgi:hypothetical protein